MPVDMRVQRRQGQTRRRCAGGAFAAQAGEQQGGALAGDHRVVDRAGGQPVDQLALGRGEGGGGAGPLEQAPAVVQVWAEVLAQPVLVGDVEHQAVAAEIAAAGVMGRRRDHRQAVAQHQAAVAVHLEVEPAAEAEHQLGVFVAVGDGRADVAAQGQDGRHGRLLGSRQSKRPSGVWPVVGFIGLLASLALRAALAGVRCEHRPA
ncbi:hypothetical protein D9M68_552380 [compost metagenome]